MADTMYFRFTFRAQSTTGLKDVAQYTAGISRETLEADVNRLDGRLDRYLRTFYNVPPTVYAERHAIRARALLGVLCAMEHCMLTFGVWLSLEPPLVTIEKDTETHPFPTYVDEGVMLWLHDSAPPKDFDY